MLLGGNPGGAGKIHRRVPAAIGVPGDGDVLQGRVPAAQQPPQLRLLRARRLDAHPAVLGKAHAAGLELQPVADGEPVPVAVPTLEPREPPLPGQERLVRVGRVPQRVPERPRGVLARPRRHLGPLGRPQLAQSEVVERPHPVSPLDAVGSLGRPLVGVRLDLLHGPVPRLTAGAGGAQQYAGLDVGDFRPHPHRAVVHDPHRAGEVGQFHGTRITLSP
ncbi:hypothetical protein QOZ88_15655 [Blastococcus sp. BMG 814]|uniref:Uncharacterized protein n=1 Tax=Blastococcus carthaginiensis TaxID=3050034 RepID=A0ABT9IEQ9_9ACTN|nr:hypothetical protein [Blastococcus carthaginiensis]MDP5184073.1 hypothetical protein [Blastococcus carthaginiensis]